MQWILGSTTGQNCDAVCQSQGTTMTCYGALAFKEVTSLAYFSDNVNNGQAGCSGGTRRTEVGYGYPSYAPLVCTGSSGSWCANKCDYGDKGTCGVSANPYYTRFCPCACPAGQYSTTGSTAACQS